MYPANRLSSTSLYVSSVTQVSKTGPDPTGTAGALARNVAERSFSDKYARASRSFAGEGARGPSVGVELFKNTLVLVGRPCKSNCAKRRECNNDRSQQPDCVGDLCRGRK